MKPLGSTENPKLACVCCTELQSELLIFSHLERTFCSATHLANWEFVVELGVEVHCGTAVTVQPGLNGLNDAC